MRESTSASVIPFNAETRPFERRRHVRMLVPNIHVQPAGDRLEILNMSNRGMAIATNHPFSVGGSYLFELQDEGRSLMVEGEVRWCQRVLVQEPLEENHEAPFFRSGVSFVGVQDRAVDPIARAEIPLPAAPVESRQDDERLTEDRIERLRQADSPDESAELLLDLLSADFEHLVLFRLQGDEIRAWLGRGPTLIPERLLRLRLSLAQTSIFMYLQRGGSFFYGMLPAMFAHLQLLRCWHGSLHRECVLFPVRIKDRLVAVLYADAADRPLTPEHLGALKAATDLFTGSLIDQILRRKAKAAEETSDCSSEIERV
jgi:hypothetical protein